MSGNTKKEDVIDEKVYDAYEEIRKDLESIQNIGYLNINSHKKWRDADSSEFGCTYLLTRNNTLHYRYHDSSKSNEWKWMRDTPFFKNKDIVQICQGTDHILALNADGVVYSWGKNDKHQLGREKNHLTNLKKSCQDEEKKDCNVDEQSKKEPNNIFHNPEEVSLSADQKINNADDAHNTKVFKIYAFRDSSFAVTRTGRVFTWGSKEYEENHKNSDAYQSPMDIQKINNAYSFADSDRANMFSNKGVAVAKMNGKDRVIATLEYST